MPKSGVPILSLTSKVNKEEEENNAGQLMCPLTNFLALTVSKPVLDL